ncbi:MAG: hypothetical protein R8M38_08475, partial [Mariprofundaceae bacterium]
MKNISSLFILIISSCLMAGSCYADEPNNSIKTAVPIEFDQDVEMQITPLHDVDFFKLEVPSKGVVRVAELSKWDKKAAGRNNPHLTFYNQDGNKIT